MSSKGHLGLNLFEANLKRHPSVKGLFDENGNKKTSINSKNEFLVLNADNKSEKESDDTSKNQEDETEDKIKDIDVEKEDIKEENNNHNQYIKSFAVQINRVEEKEVDNSKSYYTELNDEEKKQIIKNKEKYKKTNNKLVAPLSYEFDKSQKELDKDITQAISQGKNFDEIESKLKYQSKNSKK